MPAVWSGTVREFTKSTQEAIFKAFCSNFRSLYDDEPNKSEIRSWEASISFLYQNLKDIRLHDYGLIAELAMPSSGERADFILLGGSDEHPKGLIIEMKQWGSNQRLWRQKFMQNVEGDLERHPVIQALGYAGKLSCFSAIGAEIDWKCCGVLPNMDEEGITLLRSSPLLYNASDWQLFGGETAFTFADYAEEHLGRSTITKEFIRCLESAPYTQTKHYFRFMVKNHQLIEDNLFAALAAEGFALTEEQDVLCERINYAFERWREYGEKRAFFIQGSAGSGKTLVALTLFLRQAKQHDQRKVILGLTGKWMKGNLKACFEDIKPGLSHSIRGIHQFSKTSVESVELIICDEAQRMSATAIDNVLTHAPVVVVFLDEEQQLTPLENGSVENFRTHNGTSHQVQCYELKRAIRCQGGQPYHDFVEQLITGNNSSSAQNYAWRGNYHFEVFTSFDDMKATLAELYEKEQRRVALVASFTESPGDRSRLYNPYSKDNRRVGKDLVSGFDHYKDTQAEVYWMMQEGEYVKFWNKGESCKLERAASIYGAQGFESDYVGIIWGRDYIYRDGQFIEGNAAYCFDAIGKDAANRLVQNGQWCKEALRLLCNRYRIFMTRGLLGAFIYCEDEETRDYLLNYHL
jgi:DUF2075 family protein